MQDIALKKIGHPYITLQVRPVFEHPNAKIRKVVWTPFAGTDIFIRKTHAPIAEIENDAVYKKPWTEPFNKMGRDVGRAMAHYVHALKRGDFVYAP